MLSCLLAIVLLIAALCIMPFFDHWTFEYADGRIVSGSDDWMGTGKDNFGGPGKAIKPFVDSRASGRMTWEFMGRKYIEYYLKDGKYHGAYKSWAADGVTLLSCYNYVDGKEYGKQQRWDKKGGWLWNESNYVDGKMHGVQRSWWRKDVLREHAVYSDDFLHGTSTNWHENGIIASVDVHTNGLHFENLSYSLSGDIISHNIYSNQLSSLEELSEFDFRIHRTIRAKP